MRALSFALAVFASVQANAGMVQGHELLEWLESDDLTQTMMATSYIAGVNDTMQFFGQANDTEFFCTPPRFEGAGKVYPKVVSKWLNEHPEKLHFDAGSLVFQALLEAYPCPAD